MELLVTLAIAALLLGFALPGWTALMKKSQVSESVRQLTQAIQLARNSALARHRMVTICPSADGQHCSANWGGGLLVFTGDDLEVSEDERLGAYPGITSNRVEWRAFRRSSTLQFQANGATYAHNGSFVICPPDLDVRYARAIVLNKIGRPRIAEDLNGDGVVDISAGNPVSCPPPSA
jgi:type IV fimbrial biogenesis protein FimT